MRDGEVPPGLIQVRDVSDEDLKRIRAAMAAAEHDRRLESDPGPPSGLWGRIRRFLFGEEGA
jgi:hypothetical protein